MRLTYSDTIVKYNSDLILTHLDYHITKGKFGQLLGPEFGARMVLHGDKKVTLYVTFRERDFYDVTFYSDDSEQHVEIGMTWNDYGMRIEDADLVRPKILRMMAREWITFCTRICSTKNKIVTPIVTKMRTVVVTVKHLNSNVKSNIINTSINAAFRSRKSKWSKFDGNRKYSTTVRCLNRFDLLAEVVNEKMGPTEIKLDIMYTGFDIYTDTALVHLALDEIRKVLALRSYLEIKEYEVVNDTDRPTFMY